MAHDVLAAFLTALVAMQTPAPSTTPKIELSATVTGGAASAPAAQRFDIPTDALVAYAYTPATICSLRTISTTKPPAGGNGWRIEVKPANIQGPIIGVPIVVTWQRLWEGSHEGAGKTGTSTFVMQPGTSVPLDTIVGDAIRVAEEMKSHLSSWKPGMPIPPEIQTDVFIKNLQASVQKRIDEKMRMMRENGYSDTHPEIVAITNEIAAMARPLNSRVQTLVDDQLAKLSTMPPTVIDGCTATGMTLTIGVTAGGM